MSATNKIKKIIYDCLKSQNSDNFLKLTGIFNYIQKNESFPYIFISIDSLKDDSTFLKKIYKYSVSLDIFDKNTSSSFVIEITEEIKEIFKNINNFKNNYLKIIDIIFKEINNTREDNNNICKSKIQFDFIVEI